MSTSTAAAPLTFERFWRWLMEHPNCIIRAGTADATLFDHTDFHWELYDEEDGTAVLAVLKGKSLVGEMVLERADVLLVQSSQDLENPQAGYWLFELLAGSSTEESFPLAWVLMSHGMESAQGHQALKH